MRGSDTVVVYVLRVSFGSKGSMVETWIIDDFPDVNTTSDKHLLSTLKDAKSTR